MNLHLCNEEVTCIGVKVGSGIAEIRAKDKRRRPYDRRRETKELVQRFRAGFQSSICGAVHGDDVIHRLDNKATAYGETLVGRLDVELRVRIDAGPREALIAMGEAKETEESAAHNFVPCHDRDVVCRDAGGRDGAGELWLGLTGGASAPTTIVD